MVSTTLYILQERSWIMFGDPLRAMLNNTKSPASLPPAASEPSISEPPSEETLKVIEGVLDYIRSNLSNIVRTFGVNSPQHKSAVEIMDQYLDENMTRLNVDKDDVAEMLGKMSLGGNDDDAQGNNDVSKMETS